MCIRDRRRTVCCSTRTFSFLRTLSFWRVVSVFCYFSSIGFISAFVCFFILWQPYAEHWRGGATADVLFPCGTSLLTTTHCLWTAHGDLSAVPVVRFGTVGFSLHPLGRLHPTILARHLFPLPSGQTGGCLLGGVQSDHCAMLVGLSLIHI